METSSALVPLKKSTNFDLTKLASIPSFYFTNLSHDKSKIAFYWDKTGRIELYTLDINTCNVARISNGEVPRILRAGFIWARDNKRILFNKDKNGDEQMDIFMFDTLNKDLRQLTQTPKAQEYVVESFPDGDRYVVVSNRNGQMNLYVLNSENTEMKQITIHENPAGIFGPLKISKDGSKIAYTCNEEANLTNIDIYLASPDGEMVEKILQVKEGSIDTVVNFSEDGTKLAFNTDAHGFKRPGLLDLSTKEFALYGDGNVDTSGIALTKDGKYLVCVRSKNASTYPVIIDLETKAEQVIQFDPGIVFGIQLVNDQEFVYRYTSPTKASSIMKYDFITKEREILLETDYGGIDSGLFAEADHIWYESGDGTQIPAIVYKPTNYDPEKKYPGIVVPHGGPTAHYQMNYYFTAQYFADMNFVAIYPNVRGSTGYGTEFRDSTIMDWGGKDHEDWVAARKYLIHHVSADPDRIAVWGGSYGGYATLVCLTKSPKLWAAGVAAVPLSNLLNQYKHDSEHFKYFFRQQMGDPYENEELWKERSPINYAENVSSPLMLIHGENDPRCHVSESRNFVEKLKSLGRKEGKDGDFEYIEYSDHGHGAGSDIEGRIRWTKVATEFFLERMT